jgi:hypothetical protein
MNLFGWSEQRDVRPASSHEAAAAGFPRLAAAECGGEMIYAQGDILFVKVGSIPSDVMRQDGTDHILAHGEATGHCHRINRATFFVPDRPTTSGIIIGWLKTDAPAKVTHEEHAEIDLPAGTWEVRRQQQWSDDKEPRRVAD